VILDEILSYSNNKIPLNGVIHIGGYYGGEMPGYLLDGFSFLAVFEPHPEFFRRMESCMQEEFQNTRKDDYRLFNYGLGSVAGTFPLRICDPPHFQRSTFFTPLTITQDFTPGNTVDLPIFRFDQIPEATMLMNRCNFLVVDVEGMEMEVLKGMGICLSDGCNIDGMVIECGRQKFFKEACITDEMTEFLASLGYMRITDPLPDFGDVSFIHKRWEKINV